MESVGWGMCAFFLFFLCLVVIQWSWWSIRAVSWWGVKKSNRFLEKLPFGVNSLTQNNRYLQTVSGGTCLLPWGSGDLCAVLDLCQVTVLRQKRWKNKEPPAVPATGCDQIIWPPDRDLDKSGEVTMWTWPQRYYIKSANGFTITIINPFLRSSCCTVCHSPPGLSLCSKTALNSLHPRSVHHGCWWRSMGLGVHAPLDSRPPVVHRSD